MSKRPGRVTGKAAKRNSPWRKPKTWAVVGVLVAVAAGGGISWAVLSDDDSSSSTVEPPPQTPGQKWQAEFVGEVAGASQATLDYLKVVYDWTSGKADGPRMSEAADRAFTSYMEARASLAKRAPFEAAPRALLNYRDAFELYTETTRLAKLGANMTDAKLRIQIQNQIQRLRQLADRFYDLGKAEMVPFTGGEEVTTPGFEYVPTAEVPSFAGTTVAPGAPLSNPGPTTEVKREYQKTRPEQNFDEWAVAVRTLDIPTGKEMVNAIGERAEKTLGEYAVAFTEASDAVHDQPDPRGSRHVSTRIQLGLLVQAEAMRTGQIAALAAKDERAVATQIAETLTLVGVRTWDQRLGERPVDLPDTLLERKPI